MRQRLALLIASSLLLLGACGSGTGATTGATQTATAGGGTPTAAAGTEEPEATDGAGATSGGGTVASGDACKLLTADEAAQATGQANVQGGPIPLENLTDAVAGCAFVSGGTIPVLNVVLLAPDVNNNPDDMKLLPQTEEVAISGARAMWVPSAGQVLFIYKNAKVVMIQVMMPLNNDIKATAISVAQKVADRM